MSQTFVTTSLLNDMSSLLFAAHANIRLRILLALSKNNGMAVVDIAKTINVKDRLISHHCDILYRAGLISLVPAGRFRVYILNNETIQKLVNFLGAINANTEQSINPMAEDTNGGSGGEREDSRGDDTRG